MLRKGDTVWYYDSRREKTVPATIGEVFINTFTQPFTAMVTINSNTSLNSYTLPVSEFGDYVDTGKRYHPAFHLTQQEAEEDALPF